jgi:2-polyprenyl-6-methoxyphenol hydroxylase-like FAD-dependent oxidoreductase
LCGDLFTHLGNRPAVVSDDIVEPAMEAEAIFRASCLAPDTASVMRKLGDLAPRTLALMHGASYQGDGRKALYDLADAYEKQYLTPA